MKRISLLIAFSGINFFCPLNSSAQKGGLQSLTIDQLSVTGIHDVTEKSFSLTKLPLVDFELNHEIFSSNDPRGSWNEKLEVSYVADPDFSPGTRGTVTFKNISRDTLMLANVVPLGRNSHFVYITGKGDNPISRTHLFLPNRQPVNVIVPDNAWELGFSEAPVKDSLSLCALVRRTRKN